jgi:hypothetical protein
MKKPSQHLRQILELTQTEYPETQALLKIHGVGHITALTFVLTLGNTSSASSEVEMWAAISACDHDAASRAIAIRNSALLKQATFICEVS